MKSFTLHKLDDELYNRLKEEADKLGLSLNKFTKKVLRSALGLSPNNIPDRDLTDLIGMWTNEEWQKFEEDMKFFDEVSFGDE